MKSAKLTILTTGLSHGGAEAQLVRLALGLKKRDWEVYILSMLEPKAFVDELSRADIEVITLGMQRGGAKPWHFGRLTGAMRTIRPSGIITFNYPANIAGRVVAALNRAPKLVTSLRNTHFGHPMRDYALRYTRFLDSAAHVNSAMAAKVLIEKKVVSERKVVVIPNGLDLSRFRMSEKQRCKARRELGVSDNTFLWLAIGRLEAPKDYPNMFDAMSRVVGERACQLMIAGQGPLANDLETLVARRGLKASVRFLGLRQDIPLLLGAADAFVLSSAWEGMPNVVMEAFAAAKPVVATDVGGVAELVEDGVTGFLVPPKAPTALARAMKQLMFLSDAERSAMGHRGRGRIEGAYDIEVVVDRWEELLIRIL